MLYDRGQLASSVGGRHGVDAPYLRQGLCLLYHHGLRPLLANGLSARQQRQQHGLRALPRDQSRSFHGQVSVQRLLSVRILI